MLSLRGMWLAPMGTHWMHRKSSMALDSQACWLFITGSQEVPLHCPHLATAHWMLHSACIRWLSQIVVDFPQEHKMGHPSVSVSFCPSVRHADLLALAYHLVTRWWPPSSVTPISQVREQEEWPEVTFFRGILLFLNWERMAISKFSAYHIWASSVPWPCWPSLHTTLAKQVVKWSFSAGPIDSKENWDSSVSIKESIDCTIGLRYWS